MLCFSMLNHVYYSTCMNLYIYIWLCLCAFYWLHLQYSTHNIPALRGALWLHAGAYIHIHAWIQTDRPTDRHALNRTACTISLHPIAPHCTPLHPIACPCTPLHAIACHYTLLHGIVCHCTPLHPIAHYCMELHAIAHHCMPLHTIAMELHATAHHCMPWHSIAWNCMQLHTIACNCMPLHMHDHCTIECYGIYNVIDTCTFEHRFTVNLMAASLVLMLAARSVQIRCFRTSRSIGDRIILSSQNVESFDEMLTSWWHSL